MHVSVNTTSRQNHLFSSNDVRSGTYDHVGIHTLHHVWISCFSDTNNTIAFDTNVSLEDSSDGIDNQRIGNDDIQGIGRIYTRCLKPEETQ